MYESLLLLLLLLLMTQRTKLLSNAQREQKPMGGEGREVEKLTSTTGLYNKSFGIVLYH